ncbi:GlxA family transcriptional regulator [Bartonella sp. HY038]|uniref:GlxA family transcriptional regulator n=1 Tax=Bartonella sp. HY038 TaxID=2759660 RepID=UPI0015F7F311|nr:helix-turn-helix domain-containing protein [Bartonella sp. HY038]
MTHKIAVIAYEGISAFHLSVPCTVFGDDLFKAENTNYEVKVCAEKAGRLSTLSDFDIYVEHNFEMIEEADTVIIPAWIDATTIPSPGLITALQKAFKDGKRLIGLCLGTFVLAEAGLLDGREVSTHWAWADDFTNRYPNVILKTKALYIDHNNIITSAGTAAAIDCCLHIIRQDHGADIANRLARKLVVSPHRSGDQSQYIDRPIATIAQRDRLSEALEWALSCLDQPLNLKVVAEHAFMSVRSFTRHFNKKTGISFNRWLLMQRLYRAQNLLETSKTSLEDIAQQCGFSSSVTFRQHFSRVFSIPPGVYRSQFKKHLP